MTKHKFIGYTANYWGVSQTKKNRIFFKEISDLGSFGPADQIFDPSNLVPGSNDFWIIFHGTKFQFARDTPPDF